MERLSTSDVLRAAAEQISLEDRLSSTDAMFRASEEIALERGLSSPVKQRPVLSPRSIPRGDSSLLSKSAPVDFQGVDFVPNEVKFNPNLTTNVVLDNQSENRAIDQGANELLQQMGIPIKPAIQSGKTSESDPATDELQITADAAKLQGELDKKDAARAAARRAMLKSPSRSRYGAPLASKSVDGLPFDQSRASEYTKSTVQSSLSAVGAALNKLGPRESASKEALFRAMKVPFNNFIII